MALTSGTRLGPYEILAPLGAGGMGEVYRARDTRLDREVAIKVLPPAFAAEPDRVRRFEQEARAAAALNHPNILAVYDVGEHDGAPYIVSELLQGETLRERLRDGALPVQRAIEVAVQIAHGLAAAHDKGIVHRDLKPENVFITAEGRATILDFGLAKLAYGQPALASGASLLPTVAPDTLPGVVLGTVSYMSPEQVRGQTADTRADIFALGATLYEMLSGHRAFSGDTAADTMTAILRGEPPQLAGTAHSLPPALGRIVQRCLEKNPSARFQSAGDLAFALDALSSFRIEDALAGAAAGQTRRLVPGPARWTRVLSHAAAAVLGAVTVTLFLLASRSSDDASATAAPAIRATVELPDDAPLALGAQIPRIGIESPAVAVSPDGRRVAYVAETPSGTAIYAHDLAGGGARVVAGTEGAIYAFFSPDSRWLGILTNDKVMKVPVEGGTPVTLCDARVPVRATWTADDLIYFDEDQGFRVSRVPAAGGTPAAVKMPPFVLMSEALRGGDILATDWSTAGISDDYADIVLVTPAGEKTLLVPGGYEGRYVPPGFLVFGRSGNLFAVRFDLATRTVTGEPIPVATGVSMESLFGVLHASISENGAIVYVPGTNRSIGRLAWVDRAGTTELVAMPPRVYGALDLAPNGERMAIHVGDVTDYVWVYDFARREGRRFAAGQNAGWPIWTRDGEALTYSAWASPRATMSVATQPADRAGSADRVTPGVSGTILSDSWSPDGRTFAASVVGETGLRRVLVGGDRQMNTIVTQNIEQWGNEFSPDGRWLAFTSNETGQFEMYVESFPDRTTVRQISVDGGVEPRWCRCGELFYRNGNRWLSTRIRTQPDLQWDPPQVAFETDFIDTPGRSYDISPDGRRLLVVKRANPDVRNRIGVVVNWTNALSGIPPR